MSYFSNQPHNSHLVGAINQAHNNDGSSPPEVEVLLGNENEHENENENQNVILRRGLRRGSCGMWMRMLD